MTIARGQMNRQLYAERGIKSLMDIIVSNPDKFADILNILEDVPNELMGGPYLGRPPRKPMMDMLDRGEGDRTPRKMPLLRGDDEEVMERLMELQKNPDYQYDEENMYEGPRDMRMGGGIMSIPRQQYGFGSFVSSIGGAIGDVVGGAADVVGDVVSGAGDLIDPIAQVASFIPGPHQPFAAAYTTARGSGIGGDYKGLQIGGFTPSGGFGGGASSSPFSFGQAPMQTPSSGIGSFSIGDIGRIASQVNQYQDTRTGGGQRPMTGSDILGKIIQGGISLYGAKKSYDDQKRINEAQQREYENFIRRQEQFRRKYQTGEGLEGLDVRNRTRTKADVVARPGVMRGGMMDLNIRTNPQGVKEIDYRKKGGFVPPIGIKEKADDIPAMLSNNEFVFTADAVRGAGKGSVNEGAKKMYSLMKKLEAGGKA